MKISGIISLFAAAFLVYACYYDKEELLYPHVGAPAGCDTSNVTFSKSIVPLLSTYCYGCHSNANAASQGRGVRLQDYEDVKANIDPLYISITWQGFYNMPQNSPKLSDCFIREVYLWKQNNTPNN
jgi:hypothetical protein